MKGKRLIMVGRWEFIEPLGIIYLAGIAYRLGWEIRIHLVKGSDFGSLIKEVADFKPDIVGFSVWTGQHKRNFCGRRSYYGNGSKSGYGRTARDLFY